MLFFLINGVENTYKTHEDSDNFSEQKKKDPWEL